MNDTLLSGSIPENNRFQKVSFNKKFKIAVIVCGFLTGCSAISAIAIFEYYSMIILPRTTINSIPVGGLTIEAATQVLNEDLKPPGDKLVKISVGDINIATNSASLGIAYQVDETTRRAFVKGKTGNIVSRFGELAISFLFPNQLETQLKYDEQKVAEFLTDLKLLVDVIGEDPAASLATSGKPESLEINPGVPGRVLETDQTITLLQEELKNNNFEIEAIVASTSARLTDEQQAAALERSKTLVSKTIKISLAADQFQTLELNDADLVSFLDFSDDNSYNYKISIIEEKIDEWAKLVNRPPQNAVLDYNQETLEVTSFVPHKFGLELDSDKTVSDLTQKIAEAEAATEAGELQLVAETKTTEPEISLEKTNNLGIKERVGYGNSEYDHSIPNRIHNVAITTDRVSNIILAPDEEFSFNKTLGEVSSRTGYRTAYVIKNGRTELGDGGGVCQVSTTLFRSVLNAGLEVTRRLPHSYRVSYYELDTKPGIDATVYSGDVDFRFKNDTGHHLLIHGKADSKNLTMYYEIYGTSDGRTAQIVDHKVWDARPAPAPQYFDDPELPVGTTKQIDFATGGIKASFKNIIKDKNGDLIREEEYFSNYRPWSAKYLVGTKQP